MENLSIFNKKILNNKLQNIRIDDIPRWIEKIELINRWKKSIDNSDLNRTKEKQLQGLFLKDFFCEILGYKNQIGNDEWTFIQEQKTNIDATTPDGVLGYFTNADIKKDVRVIIELKDALTNLDMKQKGRKNELTPIEQAFSYAPKFGKKCKWVIVSNFKEIRLYNSSTMLEYEKFEVTNLTNIDEFKRFYFLLNSINLINQNSNSIIDDFYTSNVEQYKNITKSFYKEYKQTRLNLFKGMKENNPEVEELILFEKAQKLMDRFIFICFCEDKELLPENIFKNVLVTARRSFDPSDVKIWGQLKGLFHAIDKGNPSMGINRFNGGLFAGDKVLDNLHIPDNLFDDLENISQYDFDTDLNVNILGHIFEQSIGDIEEIKAEIKGEKIDKGSNRRKKDGIFYTPEYVTNYIVKRCIGEWLKSKRKELGEDDLPIIPEVKPKMTSGEKRSFTVAQNKHIVFWKSYANVLSNIKVLDPACGSGAFLNAAFDYLLMEGERINRELAKVNNNQIYLFDLDKNILKNNLYGVDINTESVEITKLSLWLKTANKRDPLTSLDKNIICGNSLIDDENVAGKLSLNWNFEFKEIMENGGFDIIIGNPPYGAKLSDEEKKYLDKKYKTTQYNYDTYKFFFELVFNLCKHKGYIGMITPNTYFVLEKSNLIREFLFNNYKLEELVEIYNVFPDAIVEPIISIYKKEYPYPNDTFNVICVPRSKQLYNDFVSHGIKTKFYQKDLKKKKGYLFNYHENEIDKNICEKIEKNSEELSKYLNITAGIKPYQVNKGIPKQTREIVTNKPFNGFNKLDDTWKPYMKGENIHRYVDKWDGEYIKYGQWLAESRNLEIFKNEKILIRRTSDKLIATYDNTGKVCKNTLHCIYKKSEYPNLNLKVILGLINSRLLNWKFQHDNFHMVGKPLAETKIIYISRLPIIYPNDTSEYVSIVDYLLVENQKKYDKIKNFVEFIDNSYMPQKITNKLWEFYKINYDVFIKELKKQKVKLSETMKFELFSLFNKQKKEIEYIENNILKMENRLNRLIYNLYGLTDEEIKRIDKR